jgi:hypothetical protein
MRTDTGDRFSCSTEKEKTKCYTVN